MRNEEFLVFSYCLAGLISSCLAFVVYLYLRLPFRQIVGALHQKDWSQIMKKAFPVSIFLLALSGFLFVDYSCGGPNYTRIVADRSEIIAMSQGNISEAASNIVVVLFVWALAVLLLLVTVLRNRSEVKGRDKR